MDKRHRLHAAFASRFAFPRLQGPVTPCDVAEVDTIEVALETQLPVAYRDFLVTNGPLFVPDLWDAVVQRELSAHPVREFLTPAEVVADTRLCWGGGMPRDFIGIAGDFSGSLFGFQRVARSVNRPDDLPVRLFDHDYCKVVSAADSFDGWLEWFVNNV